MPYALRRLDASEFAVRHVTVSAAFVFEERP